MLEKTISSFVNVPFSESQASNLRPLIYVGA
jgi:hypothetical protein